MAFDVTCFGEALVDMLPETTGRLRDVDTFHACSGGAPANVAVGLARLGRRVAFCGVVGDDEFGYFLDRSLGDEGIARFLRFNPDRRTGIWFVALDARGDRTFFSPSGVDSADKSLLSADLPDAVLEQTSWLHVGSSSHIHPAGQEALLDAVARASARGIPICFDPNLRVHLWDDLGRLHHLVNQVFPRCAVVKLAEEECELCLGTLDPGEAAQRLVGLGVSLACITLGERGALVQRGRERLRISAPRVQVVDTTGAGDAFVAALMSRLSPGPPLAEIPTDTLAGHLAFACDAGAQVCTQRGAIAGLPRAALST